MKKIVLTGGGTAGHVTPNIALIPTLQEKGYEVHYIGSYTGIEKKLLEDMDIPYYGISSGKLRRYFDVKNFADPFRVVKGYTQAYNLLRKIKPDVVITTGAHTAVAMCYIAKPFRKKIIYIETFANLESKTLTGRLIYPIADVFIVQWENMLKLYPKAIYIGGVY